jgi:hypothetical protein
MEAPATISIIVILLSFEKFLSKYDAKNAMIVSIIAVPPIKGLLTESIIIPPKTAKPIANDELANNPTNNIKITNKFGIIPAIVKKGKKLDSKKYININIMNNIIPIKTFFIMILIILFL